MQIYIGNISRETTEEQLRHLFGKVGTVSSIRVMTRASDSELRPFAFLEMTARSEGENAIAQLNGHLLDGRSIMVSEARPRSDKRLDTIRASIGATRPYHTRRSGWGAFGGHKPVVF